MSPAWPSGGLAGQESYMPANWYTDGDPEKATLFRGIQMQIGSDLKMRYEAPREFPREMLELVRQIERNRAEDE